MVSIPLRYLAVVSLLVAAPAIPMHADSRRSHNIRRDAQAPPVRSSDPYISRLLAEGRARSGTFARLVETISGTDGIVYVEPGECPVAGMRGCLLHVLNATAEARYLRITVDTSEPAATLIPVIGHELQHAIEVLQHPGIRTGLDILNFYRSVDTQILNRIKANSGSRAYETIGAVEVGDAVRDDLSAADANGGLDPGAR
jgi:hypothetical protein